MLAITRSFRLAGPLAALARTAAVRAQHLLPMQLSARQASLSTKLPPAATAILPMPKSVALAQLLQLPKSGVLSVVEAALQAQFRSPELCMSVARHPSRPSPSQQPPKSATPVVSVSCGDQQGVAEKAADLLRTGVALALPDVRRAVCESRPLRFDRDVWRVPGAAEVLQRARREWGIEVRTQMVKPLPVPAATNSAPAFAACSLAASEQLPASSIQPDDDGSEHAGAMEDAASSSGSTTSQQPSSSSSSSSSPSSSSALATALRQRTASIRRREDALLARQCRAEDVFPPLQANELYLACVSRLRREELLVSRLRDGCWLLAVEPCRLFPYHATRRWHRCV